MKSLIIAVAAVLSLSACSNYGKKVKSGSIEVYYKDGVGEEEAKKTADLFDRAVRDANAESSGRKSFQLTKVNDTVQLKMVADKEKLAKIDGDASLYAILYLVSDSIFSGAPVNLVLTDKKFEGFKTMAYIKKTPLSDYGTRYTSG
ncbi:MAG: hypothetical protein JNM19_04540, partial [Chitinophagaceae bacterium]|nr:hypothetical protein [Chitinophagaceae bacterium]